MNKPFLVLLLSFSLTAPSAAVLAKTMTVEAESVVMPSAAMTVPAVPAVIAQAPVLAAAATGRDGKVRVSFVSGTQPSVEYSVREISTGLYVNPLTGKLGSKTVWATADVWGGAQGTVVHVESIASPRFVAYVKNSAGQTIVSQPTAPLDNYRAGRDRFSAAMEGSVYLLGLAVFAGLAWYEFWKLRPDKKKKKK